MIVILDTASGEAYNFKFRKDSAEFIGVSVPTLRGWLQEPFFLYKTLIITEAGNGKIESSLRALQGIRLRMAAQRKKALVEKYHVQGSLYSDRNPGTDNS